MCGLVGIVDFNNSNKNFNPEINNMINKIQHRGPDNNKIGSYKVDINFHSEVKAAISIKIDKIQTK